MEKNIILNGQQLHYDVSGSGTPLILMHGWGCDHNTVNSIASVAARTNTVYNLDMPGFGQSPEPPAIWTVDDYTHMVEELIITLGLDKVILVGHSFGGRVTIQLAAARPELVDALVLVDAAGIKPRRSLRYYYKVYSFKLIKKVIHSFFPAKKAEELINKLRNKRGSSDYNNASQRMKAIMSRVVNLDLTPCLHKIKSPTLLVWGENDTATPLADAKLMEKIIPDAGLVVFPGCGHYSFLENPGQFAAVLHSFLCSRKNQN